ncbi:hypothetical protein GCM10023198_24260 [Promicromonospora umidemergens]|uniref:Uncharacterized protein n=1 Tax=Promicromonospora umidemergens TaxID=629679 RepID=A0ABP8XAI1_9MICO
MRESPDRELARLYDPAHGRRLLDRLTVEVAQDCDLGCHESQCCLGTFIARNRLCLQRVERDPERSRGKEDHAAIMRWMHMRGKHRADSAAIEVPADPATW